MTRFIVLSIFAIYLNDSVSAQVTMPAPYSNGIKVNYVRTWQSLKPYANEADVVDTSRSSHEVMQTTVYLDGLGRQLQTVRRRGALNTGNSPVDIVEPIIYDEFGRQTYQYLPFAANSTGGNSSLSDGHFKLNAFQQDSAFNKGLYSDETFFYGKTFFEASPLKRILESYSAGNSWVGTANETSESNKRGMKVKYWVNTVADSVRIWNVANVANNLGTYSTSGIYPAATLYKTVSQNEHNKQIIEFRDKTDKVILKKIQLTASSDSGSGRNHAGWICTYYIYDDRDQLRAVVQPKGVDTLSANSWSMSYGSNVILNEQTFRYEYDGQGNMIMKKSPGAGCIYAVFDAKQRVVMMQDSNLRVVNKWMVSKYDARNRPTETGLWENNTSFASHRSSASISTDYPTTSSNYEELTKMFYDDYSWRSGEGNPLAGTRSTSYDSHLISPNDNSFPYPQNAVVQASQLRDMITGTKAKVLDGGSNYLYTVSFYDEKNLPTQIQSMNYSGGIDVNTIQYTWTGQPLLNVTKHEKAGENAQTTITITKLTYDALFRKIKTEKKIGTTKVNGGTMPGSWTVQNELAYDALGQLKSKVLGDALEVQTYEYNIRGWLLGMNRSFAKDTAMDDRWFGYDLGYDKTNFTVSTVASSYANAQFNGNISGMVWKSLGDGLVRKYDLSYDVTNRLTGADFNQFATTAFSKNAGVDFSVSGISYDQNGNLLGMKKKGWKLGGSVTIDSLVYGYFSNSNRLNHVFDGANDAASRLGDFKEITSNTSQDYSYDPNGNMTADNNKSISSITYNHLNLPSEISIEYPLNPPYSTRGVSYVYDATGSKLKKEVSQSSGLGINRLVTSLYLNGFIYGSKITNQGGSPEGDDYVSVLQSIPTEEGRARINSDSSQVVYDFMIKDHLGNVRATLTNEVDTAFYPVATMETAQSGIEEIYYANLPETREDHPGYTDTYTNPNDKVARLLGDVGNQTVIGPAITLKVMRGDNVDIRVSSWWKDDPPVSTPINPLSSLLSNLNSSIGSVTGSHGTSGELTASNILSVGANEFLTGQSFDNTKPKAYINWILFDEHFKYVSGSSGYEQIGSANSLTIHTPEVNIVKNGFLFIYVSNATPDIYAYFDNLQVSHRNGPLVADEHYYPFGLTMKGISSRALTVGGPSNKYSYNNKEKQDKEFGDDAGLDWSDYGARMYDYQIGRLHTQDPLADAMRRFSPYSYCYNNPVNYFDFEGLMPINPNDPPKYYRSRHLAALAWTQKYGLAARKQDKGGKAEEWSGLIYKIKYKGEWVFGYTDAVQWPEKEFRWKKSPGPYDPVHKMPPGAVRVGHIHIHWEGSGKANEDFSDNFGKGDTKFFRVGNNLYFYLLNSVGTLKGRYPDELEPDDPMYDPSNPNWNSDIEGDRFTISENAYTGNMTFPKHSVVFDDVANKRHLPVNSILDLILTVRNLSVSVGLNEEKKVEKPVETLSPPKTRGF